MKAVLIRDDDVSFFTDIRNLKKVYDKSFFNKGLKVSLSIIPDVSSSLSIKGTNNSFARNGYLYEPFIPENRINTGSYLFSKNKKVAAWMRKNESIEACIHGYSHALSEFTSNDKQYIGTLLNKGEKIIASAVGKQKKLKTFVAPHERLSKTAWGVLSSRGFYIFRNIIRPLKDAFYTVPAGQYGLRHLQKQFFTGFNGIVRYRNGIEMGCMNPYLFSCFWDPEQSFEHACAKFDKTDLFIMTNHHWEFPMNKKLLYWWKEFLKYMTEHEIRSFSAAEAVELALTGRQTLL